MAIFEIGLPSAFFQNKNFVYIYLAPERSEGAKEEGKGLN